MAFPTRIRLTVVSVIVALLVIVGVGVVRAADPPALPPIEADRLLANTASVLTKPITISGDVETRLDLGLPDVPSGLGGEGGAVAMINGAQRFRVWHSPDGLRIAHITQVSERDLVVNDREAWWWDGSTMTATRVDFDRLAARMSRVPGGPAPGPSAAMGMDPITLARQGIEALAPYASVTVDGTDEVAGRAVYELVLTPLTDGTLIGSIELSIDAESWLPLRSQVIARASGEAAMSAGFSRVSYEAVDPKVFEFAPAPGAEVLDALDEFGGAVPSEETRRTAGVVYVGDEPTVFGRGFESTVAIPLSQESAQELRSMLPYAGPLFSAADVTVDGQGWLLVGAVPLDALRAEAESLS